MVATVSVTMPESLKQAAEDCARELGVGLDAFIASAVAETVCALRSVDDLTARAKRADRAAFRDVLARAGRGQPPLPADEVPPASTGPDLTGPDLTGDERS